MRKHDVRKWLHAILDLLPVMLIPVFMIYSHRHTLTERTEVDIQYKYQSNEVNSVNDLVIGNIYFIEEMVFDSSELYGYSPYLQILQVDSIDFDTNDDFFISEIYVDTYDSSLHNNLYIQFDIDLLSVYFTNDDNYCNVNSNNYNSVTLINTVFIVNDDLLAFNSTCHFFEDSLPQYTDYNVIESVDVQDTNSDIMSVFMDDFNNAIDKYFNMGNVFNLGGVYQWFNTNIFSGHAPTVIYSIWNIALYELVMDLLFLLYGLFMWFIDMVEKIMDKPFKSIK